MLTSARSLSHLFGTSHSLRPGSDREKDVLNMKGEHVKIEVANTMLGPSSYFHVRVFSLSFHTSMMTYVSDIASELLPCKSSRGG